VGNNLTDHYNNKRMKSNTEVLTVNNLGQLFNNIQFEKIIKSTNKLPHREGKTYYKDLFRRK